MGGLQAIEENNNVDEINSETEYKHPNLVEFDKSYDDGDPDAAKFSNPYDSL